MIAITVPYSAKSHALLALKPGPTKCQCCLRTVIVFVYTVYTLFFQVAAKETQTSVKFTHTKGPPASSQPYRQHIFAREKMDSQDETTMLSSLIHVKRSKKMQND